MGYNFEVGKGSDRWSAKSRPGPFPKEHLRLLKPHGSLHWANLDRTAERLDLHPNPYRQRAAKTNLIPPTWDKSVLGQWPWKPVWEESSRLLQRVRCLIVVGYSVPATDLMSQALVKSSLSTTELRLLVVVNPDPAARGRVVNLAQGAIRPRTRIVELEALQDFGLLLEETPDERRKRTATMMSIRKRFAGLEDRIDQLDEVDPLDIESRLEALEQLEGRLADLEAVVED